MSEFSDHEALVKLAGLAITAVFSDLSVDKKTTIESLKSLKEEIEILIDAVNTSKG